MKRGVFAIGLLLLLGFAALFTIYANSQDSAMVELVAVGTGSQLQSRSGGNKTRRTRWASISLCWGGDQPIVSKYIAVVVVQRMPKYTGRRTFHTPKLPSIHPCYGTAKLRAR